MSRISVPVRAARRLLTDLKPFASMILAGAIFLLVVVVVAAMCEMVLDYTLGYTPMVFGSVYMAHCAAAHDKPRKGCAGCLEGVGGFFLFIFILIIGASICNLLN